MKSPIVEFLRVTQTRSLGKLRVRSKFHVYLSRRPAIFQMLVCGPRLGQGSPLKKGTQLQTSNI